MADVLALEFAACQLSPGVPGPLFPVVSGMPWVFGLGCRGIAARCGVGGRGDVCWKFLHVRPRVSGRLRDGECHAASGSVPQSMGVC
ncbi:MAG TPA: hypothetical protein VIM11_25540 [Tepidisphaeraceae bacterium]|jgi:hypothetical protein